MFFLSADDLRSLYLIVLHFPLISRKIADKDVCGTMMISGVGCPCPNGIQPKPPTPAPPPPPPAPPPAPSAIASSPTASPPGQAASAPSSTQSLAGAGDKITICYRDGGGSAFVQATIFQSDVQARDLEAKGNLIPAPATGCGAGAPVCDCTTCQAPSPPPPSPTASPTAPMSTPAPNLGAPVGIDWKLNIRCADWRDQAHTWAKAKQLEYLYKCQQQDCVQSLEPKDANGALQSNGIPMTPGCRYMDSSFGNGFCYAYNSAQMYCKNNPGYSACQNDQGESAAKPPLGTADPAIRKTSWRPGSYPMRGTQSGTASCSCVKQCACKDPVFSTKKGEENLIKTWECRCVDPNQAPVGPGSAKPTAIYKDSGKGDECGCACTVSGAARRRHRRRNLLSVGSSPTISLRQEISSDLLLPIRCF